jgi:uncharacterized YigZ family protein
VAELSTYLTVAGDGEAEIEVRRSRFRCHVARVESEDAARQVVAAARARHWDARHHCSAFVIGARAHLQRSNDDGEPAGTAGAPMLEVLTRREVSDVVAVVTRWFGGTLLGAGGLVRAYSEAVAAGLDEVGLLRRSLHRLVDVEVPHADAGRLENDVRSHGITVRSVDYAAAATLHLAVPVERADDLLAQVAAWTAGDARVEVGGTDWVDLR